MLRKIACNATNSGAIDQDGNVYCWGAAKYGLLGNPKRKNPVSHPIKVELRSDKLTLDNNVQQSYVATSIAFGQYHAAAVVNDINTNSDFNFLLYAESILAELKTFLLKYWENDVKKSKPTYKDLQEEYAIEHTLKFSFRRQEDSFPYISIDSLKEFMVNTARLSFKDTVSYNRLFQDLSDPLDDRKINLKELRDQLIGRRCGNGVVFAWGIINDGRLGIKLTEEERERIKNSQPELLARKPQIVEFSHAAVIISKVSCGISFTLALSSDGFVYSWGQGSSGGLGLGEVNVSETPQMITLTKNGHPFQNIKDIAVGANHTLALDSQFLVFSWGNGQGGRLGHGDETGENIPKEIVSLRDKKVKLIEAGEASSACISIRNELYIWGVGLHGRLGTGQTNNILSPSILEDLKDQKVEDVTLGTNTAFCLLRNGKAMGWGASKFGKLGVEAALDRNFAQPKEIMTLEEIKVFQFSSGPFHTLALTETGEIYSFGNVKDGKLGLDDNNPNVYIPKRMPLQSLPPGFRFALKGGLNDRSTKYPLFKQYDDYFAQKPEFNQTGSCEIIQVTCGFSNSVFLLNDGQLFTCGSNKYGQLGLSKKSQKEQKDDDDEEGGQGNQADGMGGTGGGNDEFENQNVNDVSQDEVLPLQLRKKLHQLQEYQDVDVPTIIPIKHDAIAMRIKFIATGYFHVFAVTHEGVTFGWGRNDYGQLGLGRKDQTVVAKPTRIKALLDKKIVMVAAGENHSLFLNDMGEVLSAGFNEFGELGVGAQAVLIENEKNIEERYDENFQKQQIDSKIELTPKVLKNLESIGFIAAGKNHSLAIRSYKVKEKELKMYTWGCGWHGQTGHGSWNNEYLPKVLKSNYTKDTKFIMASCGSKHTLALDANGQIWYFGNKMSVGIEDLQEDKQFTPVRLDIPQHLMYEPIKYIASGEEHNLCVFESGTVYGFGKNNQSKINSNKKESVFFERVDSDERARLIGCGANHSVMINLKGIPFTWGNTLNGRCGLKLESEDMKKKQESISNPTVVYSLKVLFNAEIIKMKERLGEVREKLNKSYNIQGEENDQEQEKNIRFKIQKILKDQLQSLDEDNLTNQDRFLMLNFNRLVEDFHILIRSNNETFLNSLYNAQNSVISRVLTFPTRIELLNDVKAELPKAIIIYKQQFEKIFTYLQIHPCYIINWITRTTVNRQPKEVVYILKTVFGDKEIRNDPRIIHTLMMISQKIFTFEIETYDLKEILSGRIDSTFSYLFNLIFENQDENILYINSLISRILFKLQKFFSRDKDKNLEREDFNNDMHLYLLFDYETDIQDQTKAENRIKYLIKFMEICFQIIIKTLDPQYKTGQSGTSLSNEIFSLIYVIKQEINAKKQADLSLEDIDSYILTLVFESLFKKLQELNFQKIKDLYWKRADVPPIDVIFNFSEKRNLISVFADHMEKYLRNKNVLYSNKPVQKLKAFIANPQNSYRYQISKLLNQCYFNFDYLLIKDLFINSMQLKNPHLNISVNDLIFIYNSLVEKGEIIYVQDHANDPLKKLVRDLGNTVIEIKKNEKHFISDEILEYRMNLEIKSRILIDYENVTKCCDCNAPVYEELLPSKRFRNAIEGISWMCQNCSSKNDPHLMRCGNNECNKIRNFNTLPKDQVFLRYKQIVNDPMVNIFQQILIYMPLIDVHEKIDKIIDQEMATEERKKGADYIKLAIIEEFKRYKFNYMFQNKKKIMGKDDELEEKRAENQTENEFLNYLEREICQSYEAKKRHEEKLKEYQKLIQEIKDKISNYVQKNNQYRDEFKLIIDNAYTGLGSEFLQGEKQDIFAGRLHLKGSKKAFQIGGNQKSLGKMQGMNANLENYFNSLKKTQLSGQQMLEQNYQQIVQNKDAFLSNFKFFGKYPLYLLRQRKVLFNIEIHGKKLQTIMKKCCYVFYDDGNNGFKVDLVYEEANRSCLIFGKNTHEQILETFLIEKDTVAEMRRIFATKATIQFGNSQFNIFELVFLLNEIKAKTYVYGIKTSEKSHNVDGQGIKIGGMGQDGEEQDEDADDTSFIQKANNNNNSNKKNKEEVKDNKI